MTQTPPLSAVEIAYKIQNGKAEPAGIIQAHLAHIARTDTDIQAWEYLNEDWISDQLRNETVRETVRGALSGVPVGVKDIIDCADIPCCYNSPLFQDRVPSEDARIIQQLKAAGAVILGKTRTTEFAYLQHCQTRNPHQHAYSPGGSSSGSAAAVAAGHVPLALGSQTGGSVIRPASYCGVFGFKPSFEAFSRTGVLQTAQHLDHIGVFARHLEDIGLICNVLMDAKGGDFSAAAMQRQQHSPHFVFDDRLLADEIMPYAMAPLIQLVSRLGAQVETISLDTEIQRFHHAHSVIYDREYAENIGPMIAANPALASEFTQNTVARGQQVSQSDYDTALAVRDEAISLFTELLGRNRYLLLPSATSEAPFFEEGTGNPACSKFTSLCGLPALSIPHLHGLSLSGPDGLPLGVQIVGAAGNDRGVIAAGRWLAEYCAENSTGER